jgi:hypothetical protein
MAAVQTAMVAAMPYTGSPSTDEAMFFTSLRITLP